MSEAGTDILFRYTVAAAGSVSIGVYADAECQGKLLHTILSGVHHEAGQYIGYWHGRDRRGDVVGAPTSRGILKQYSNVKYEFQGVIGNNSLALTGAGVWDTVHNPPKACFWGKEGWVASAYIEGDDVGFRKFNVDNPRECVRIHERDDFATRWVCTDGNLVYWLGFTGPQDSMISATRVSDDSEWVFSAGTRVNLSHSSYSGIGLTYTKQYVTGGTVQRNGRFLVASYKSLNQLWVFDKLSGERLFTVAVDAPRELTFTTDGVLWVIHGETNPVCEKYTVTSEGVFTATGITLANLVDPVDVASNFDGSIVAAIDSSRTHDCTTTARHRVHAYNGSSGEVAWTFGRTEGYEDARVYPDKFCLINTKEFEDTTIGQSAAWLAFEPDGHLWVGDVGNHRSQRFSPQREYVDQIQAIGYFYSAACDPSKPEDVYGNWNRYHVTYPNLTWEHTHNYSAYRRKEYDAKANRFQNVNTLPSGRTYWLAQSQDRSSRTLPKMFVEVTDTQCVYTNQFTEHFNVVLNKDGSLSNVEPTLNGENLEFGRIGDTQRVNRRYLTSDPTDPAQFPTWGAKQVQEVVPAVTVADPVTTSYPLGPNQFTASGKLVVFSSEVTYDGPGDNGRARYKERGGYDHLGIIQAGEYLVKTSASTTNDYQGNYPLDGGYDVGNDTWGQGDRMQALGNDIFYHVHGEHWKARQLTGIIHYRDTGLLASANVVTNRSDNPSRTPAPLGLSSNATSNNLVRVGADAYFYSNTEGFLGGVHRYRITGLDATTVEYCAPQLGTLGTNSLGTDQLAGLPKLGTLVDGTAGWFRTPSTDTPDFLVQLGLYETGRLDVSVRARPALATGEPVRASTVGRALDPLVAPGSWRLTGTLRYLLSSFDELGDTAPFEIPDKNGLAIIRITRPNRQSVRQLEVNGEVVGSYDADTWAAQMYGDALLDAGIDEGGLYVEYAGFPKFYPASTADARADMLRPAGYQFRTQLTPTSGREYGMDFTNVRFLDKQAPVVPTTFNATTTPSPVRMIPTVSAPPPPGARLGRLTLTPAEYAAWQGGKRVFVYLEEPTGITGPPTLLTPPAGTGGGTGPSGIARDPLAVGDVATITAAVTDASNVWTDGDLTAYGTPALQDAGAPAAVAGQNSTILVGTADVVTLDEFDYPDAGGGGAWRYRYGRRNDGTSGWTRTPKG